MIFRQEDDFVLSLKAQVSYSDRLLFVVRLLTFHLLLKIHKAIEVSVNGGQHSFPTETIAK